ncbi:hypothetical protein K438DRAFT_1751312 [Mycena galopus ATCC 62051]|nr:hypothetical protein K438DRAFT_1751312 [Mycena galopus ATCC 62051]
MPSKPLFAASLRLLSALLLPEKIAISLLGAEARSKHEEGKGELTGPTPRARYRLVHLTPHTICLRAPSRPEPAMRATAALLSPAPQSPTASGPPQMETFTLRQ